VEIAWLAGIIEGEGSFDFQEGGSPKIKVKMTDEDVIKHISSIWKRPYYKEDNSHLINHKDGYHVSILGQAAIEWMFTIYTLMKSRRKAKILEIINKWKVTDTVRSRFKFFCGHEKSKENTYKYGRYTKCRTCSKLQMIDYKRRQRLNG
jgi:hypothetical protein